MANGVDERSGREIRLLLLVIAIAVAGLVVLARFRFPAANIVAVSPTPSPLERIVARAPFEDLSKGVSDASARVAALVAAVEFEQVVEPRPAKANAETPEPPLRRFLPALRVRPDRWIAYQPKGMRAIRSAGGPVMIAGEDAARELVLLALSGPSEATPAVSDAANAAPGIPSATFVLAVEAAAAGPALRPVFFPRLDPVSAMPWSSPVLRVGGTPPIAAGAFVFTFEGRLIGLAVPHDDGVAIVAAAMLDRLAGELAGGMQ